MTRRLVIVVLEEGGSLEIDYDPVDSFASWEAAAALEEAARIVRADMDSEEAE